MIGKFLAIKATRPDEECWITRRGESQSFFDDECLFKDVGRAEAELTLQRFLDKEYGDNWVYTIIEINCHETPVGEI